MTAPNFAGLSFAVVPVVSAGVLTAALTAGTTRIAAIVDPTMTQKIYNPVSEGNAVASGDNATKWLPVVASISAAQVTDYIKDPTGATTDVGQVTLNLTPAAANVVESSSVMSGIKLSPQALLITATGTF
jgi:hypothetical protein